MPTVWSLLAVLSLLVASSLPVIPRKMSSRLGCFSTYSTWAGGKICFSSARVPLAMIGLVEDRVIDRRPVMPGPRQLLRTERLGKVTPRGPAPIQRRPPVPWAGGCHFLAVPGSPMTNSR